MRPTALLLAALLAVPASAQVLPSFGSDRAGTVGFQFLKIPVDARSIGLGNSGVTSANDASALFWNPALAAEAGTRQAMLARANWFEGPLFTTNYAAVTYPVGKFVVGASLQTMDSGEMDVTTEFQPEGTGQTFRLLDLAVGATLGQRLTDQFAYGVTFKAVRESVADLSTTTAAADVGIHYKVGDTGARMAVAIRNFGLDASPSGTLTRIDPNATDGTAVVDSFAAITVPTSFLLGLAYDVTRFGPDHALTVSSQLYRPADNAETLGLAAEYTFRRLLSLRTGYRFGGGQESSLAAGVGVNVPVASARARFDYGFSRTSRLGNVHALGLNLAF